MNPLSAERETSPAAGAVDVLIAAWNRAGTIERAVRSALDQPEVGKVIVVDDASSDDTSARAEAIARENGRVVVERLARNGGPAAARNRALALSSAPWIAILDGDDFLLPGRIGKLLAAAGDFDFVADDLLQVGEAEVDTKDPQPMMLDSKGELWRLDLETFVNSNTARRGSVRTEMGFLKPLIRRAFLDNHQLRYDETLRLGEDYSLYAFALAFGARFLIMPAQGYVSVVRPDSLSARHSKEDLERHRDADLALAQLPGLTASERETLKRHYRATDCRVQWVAVINAVNARNVIQFVAPFGRSRLVSAFLVGKLIGEAGRRILPAPVRMGRR